MNIFSQYSISISINFINLKFKLKLNLIKIIIMFYLFIRRNSVKADKYSIAPRRKKFTKRFPYRVGVIRLSPVYVRLFVTLN